MEIEKKGDEQSETPKDSRLGMRPEASNMAESICIEGGREGGGGRGREGAVREAGPRGRGRDWEG